MAETISPEQEHFGPAIRIDDTSAGIEVDAVTLGENLQRDFPELTQADWDNTILRFTAGLGEGFGGLTADMMLLRSSRSLRTLGRLMHGIGHVLLDRPRMPDYDNLDRWSEGRDVLVLVNTNSEMLEDDGRNNPFNQEMDRSAITAHELKHAADHLFYHKVIAPQLEGIDKQAKSTLLHIAASGGGLSGVMAGLVGMFAATGPGNENLSWPWQNQEVFLGSGLTIMGGLALAAAPVYLILKHNTLAAKKFGIEYPDMEEISPYGHTEEHVHAYTLATRHNWEGVVT